MNTQELIQWIVEYATSNGFWKFIGVAILLSIVSGAVRNVIIAAHATIKSFSKK